MGQRVKIWTLSHNSNKILIQVIIKANLKPPGPFCLWVCFTKFKIVTKKIKKDLVRTMLIRERPFNFKGGVMFFFPKKIF